MIAKRLMRAVDVATEASLAEMGECTPEQRGCVNRHLQTLKTELLTIAIDRDCDRCLICGRKIPTESGQICAKCAKSND